MKIKGINLPDGLRPLAQYFMKGVIERLDKEGRLDRLDELSLFLLAGNIDKYLMCDEFVALSASETAATKESARGNQTIHPLLTYQKQIQGNIAVLLKEMGLTLGSRSKLKSPEKEEESLAERLARI